MKAVEERRGTGREEETGVTKISRGMKERREQEDGVISEERPKVTIIARSGASMVSAEAIGISMLSQFVTVRSTQLASDGIRAISGNAGKEQHEIVSDGEILPA